jgi:hypothetical protein
MCVPKILNELREERARLQRELETLTAVINRLESLKPRGRGRPRRLPELFELEARNKSLPDVAQKSA